MSPVPNAETSLIVGVRDQYDAMKLKQTADNLPDLSRFGEGRTAGRYKLVSAPSCACSSNSVNSVILAVS